ncbi:hypothetical protein, variant 1 [Aphanomyces astaci]|uniref:Mif2/CENP-C cupin domain-containing protein n=1 Tax=Aphanomyces astaci TaxID=112090 RepID=W4G968_APHAT|nr:hypothetical protein, variant 1 [Aphanomyces astaci]ETV75574.1 hypothetical protein, variant 1 [Aphanomyces astaci]|eukprot:XP_009834706.1 hypothetical protein, variant 1 [Aphanomyces astaci]
MSSVDATRAIGRRSGVVVRKDVRRDSDGFEDIDDFWDDDDSSAANDSTTDIQRPGDAFEFTGRAGKSPATKSVLRTPKKASDPGPNVHRNSDGFDDIDEFWVQAGASANTTSPSGPRANESGELGGTDLEASSTLPEPEKTAPPTLPKKHTHLNRRQRRNTFGSAPPSSGQDENDRVQQGVATSQPVPASRTAITPPFARRSKFPSSTPPAGPQPSPPTDDTTPVSTTSSAVIGGVAIKDEPAPSPVRDEFSFGNMSSPASTVKSLDLDSPATNSFMAAGLTPSASRRHPTQNIERTPSPTPTLVRDTPTSRLSDTDRSMAVSEQHDEREADDAAPSRPSPRGGIPRRSAPPKQASPPRMSAVDFDGRESNHSPPSSPVSPSSSYAGNRDSVGRGTNDLDESRFLDDHDVDDEEDVMPKVPTSRQTTSPSRREVASPRPHKSKNSISEDAHGIMKTPQKKRKHRVVDRQEFEFGMASPHDDDPFEGNLTPIAHAEDHTLYTPPSSPTKQQLQKPKQTKTLKSVGKKAKPRSNRRRKASADAGSDVESSFALTDQSRMDSESEHSDVDVTVLSNADAIRRDSDSDGDGRGVRRSKRRRIKPLEWYKCERPVYERRQSGVGLILPTISHVERAGTKTPVKLKPHKSSYQSKTTPFPTADLPSEFSYLATDTGDIWDELHDDATKMRVIGRSKSSQVFALPGVQGFPCGYAGQTFNLPGGPTLPTWISGRLLLPPSGVKQPESVGNCTQSFVVLQCQPGALEVAYAHPSEGEYNDETAQRFLLSQGDEYFVPPNNAYYLRNHSKSVEAELRFTIMKPSRLQVAEAGTTSGNKKTKKAKIN